MANSSTSKSSLPIAVVKSLWDGATFCALLFWRWPVLSAIALFIGALGVSAMYGDQYIVAACAYFICVTLLTARTVAESQARKEKAGVALVIVSVGTGVCAVLLWLVKYTYEGKTKSQTNIVSLASSWVWTSIAAIVNPVPWRWVLPATAIGFVLAALIHVLRERQRQGKHEDTSNGKGNGSLCQDEWLHKKLETDTATMKDLVWIDSIVYWPDFDKSQPRIEFVFNVLNLSLFDVVITMNGGHVLFGDENEQFHFDPKFIAKDPAYCRSRDGTNFVVRQAVTRDEIERRFKQTDDTRISFGNLRIGFYGTEQFPEILRTQLDVNHFVFTAKREWRNPNHLFHTEPLLLPRTEQTEAERALTLKTLPAETSEPQLSPSLALIRTRLAHIESDFRDDAVIKFEMSNHDQLDTAVVEFGNEISSVKIKDLRALITFYDEQGNFYHRVNKGWWVSERFPNIDLDVGETASLILLHRIGGDFGSHKVKRYHIEDNPNDEQGVSDHNASKIIDGLTFRAQVVLLYGPKREVIGTYDVDLALDPAFGVRASAP